MDVNDRSKQSDILSSVTDQPNESLLCEYAL